MKFRTEFVLEIDVEFLEPEKSKAYFIDGDWRDSFYSFDSLEEMAGYLAHSIHDENSYFDQDEKCPAKAPEGYGIFTRQDDDSFKLIDRIAEISGGIIVRCELELEQSDTSEIK